MNMYRLECFFDEAIGKGKKYIGVLTKENNDTSLEVYTQTSFKEKIRYLKNAYDKDLRSNYRSGLSIVDYASGDNLAQIEDALFETKWIGKTNLQAMSTEQLVGELKKREGVKTFATISLDDEYVIKTENIDGISSDKVTTIRENTGPCTILEVID